LAAAVVVAANAQAAAVQVGTSNKAFIYQQEVIPS